MRTYVVFMLGCTGGMWLAGALQAAVYREWWRLVGNAAMAFACAIMATLHSRLSCHGPTLLEAKR